MVLFFTLYLFCSQICFSSWKHLQKFCKSHLTKLSVLLFLAYLIYRKFNMRNKIMKKKLNGIILNFRWILHFKKEIHWNSDNVGTGLHCCQIVDIEIRQGDIYSNILHIAIYGQWKTVPLLLNQQLNLQILFWDLKKYISCNVCRWAISYQ